MAKKIKSIRVDEELYNQFTNLVEKNGDNKAWLLEAFMRTYLDGEIILVTDNTSRLKVGIKAQSSG